MSRIPRVVIEEVLARAQGHCEACGAPALHHALHHRHPRGAGGSRLPWIDTAANLLAVHPGCHNLTPWSIHQNPIRSYRLGHLVHYGIDPASVPVIAAANLRELRA